MRCARWTLWCLLVALAGALAPSAAFASSGTLAAGATLTAGQSILSPSGEYQLTMQSDGNLVEYVAGGRFVWSAHTSGNPGAHAIMQTNGDLVVADASGATIWSSNSHAPGCASQLAVQDDGNLVIYDPGDTAIWYSGIVDRLLGGDQLRPGWSRFSAADNAKLIMQSDGNLVLYGAGGARWNSATEGHPGAFATMQSDGNLVVYAPGGGALWNSATAGHSGDSAVVQSDGNLVIYDGSGAIWNTRTGNGQTNPGYVGPSKPPAGSCPPPPPPPPPAPVVTAPVTTPVPTPAQGAPGTRPLRIRMAISWTWDRATTRLRRVRIGSAPRHTRLAIGCAGRGCPRRHRTLRASGLRAVRRVLVDLAGRRYRAGEQMLLTLAAPGYQAERVRIRFRWGRAPQVRLLSR